MDLGQSKKPAGERAMILTRLSTVFCILLIITSTYYILIIGGLLIIYLYDKTLFFSLLKYKGILGIIETFSNTGNYSGFLETSDIQNLQNIPPKGKKYLLFCIYSTKLFKLVFLLLFISMVLYILIC